VTDVTDKVERAIARFERVTRHIDEREGTVRDAAKRERERLNAGLARTLATVVVAVGVIWLAAVVIGVLLKPIGMFGFLGAIAASIAVAVALMARGGRRTISTPAPAADLPNGPMVERFDSYLYRTRRALPAAAQAQIDAISSLLPPLRETLERVDALDPTAQDARRLMSIHLPGLIDRYARVPAAFRQEQDGEGKTVDERLVEGLAAGRQALAETAQQLARADIAAVETQGRFIKSRYGEERIDG
jgi:hypothetical protein